jgi:hypothetical protein
MLMPFLETFHRTVRLSLRSEVPTFVRRIGVDGAAAGVTLTKTPQVLPSPAAAGGGARGVAIAGS